MFGNITLLGPGTILNGGLGAELPFQVPATGYQPASIGSRIPWWVKGLGVIAAVGIGYKILTRKKK